MRTGGLGRDREGRGKMDENADRFLASGEMFMGASINTRVFTRV